MWFSLIVLTVGLMTAYAHAAPHQTDMTQAVKNAKTSADHNLLAERYEDTAKEMQSKVDEHKKMLAEYEAHSEYYGRAGLDMESMCKALIRVYEQAAKENKNLADSHRKMAAETK